MRRLRGFTLIELMVVVSIIGILLVEVVPWLGDAVANARAHDVESKFIDDFSYLRSYAVSSGNGSTVQMQVSDSSGNCTWTATVNGATSTAHSMTAAQLASSSGMKCVGLTPVAGQAATGLPVVLTFLNNGTLQVGGAGNTAAGLQIQSRTKQSWNLTIYPSGSLIVTGHSTS